MAETFKHLAQDNMVHTGNAAAQELYEAPAGTTTIIGHIRLANNSSASRSGRLTHGGIRGSGYVGKEFVILPDLTIESGGWAEFTGSIILDAGDKLYGLASVDSVSISYNIYGLEVT